MRFWVNALLVPADQLLPIARAADELGYEGIALADHPVMPQVIESPYPGGLVPWTEETEWPDPWVQIGAMAAVTARLRFATNVYVLPVRHPLVTAKAVATAAHLSNGRVILGVGVGWMAEEFAALGQDFTTRGARTDEILEILRRVFRGGPVEYHGRHYDIPALRLNPTPGRPVPIWIGGETPAALRRAARLGDGWISGRAPADIAELIPVLQRNRREAGRAGDPLEIAASASERPTRIELDAWRGIGVDHLKVAPWHWYGAEPEALETKLSGLQRFAEDFA